MAILSPIRFTVDDAAVNRLVTLVSFEAVTPLLVREFSRE